MVVLNVEVPEATAERLRQIAGARETSPEAVMADALRWYLQDQAALEAAIADGEADAAAGRVIPHEEVMREMESWAAGIRARRLA